MSNIVPYEKLGEYWRKRQSNNRAEYEKRNGFKLDALIERVGVLRRQEIDEERDRLIYEWRNENDNGGYDNAE